MNKSSLSHFHFTVLMIALFTLAGCGGGTEDYSGSNRIESSDDPPSTSPPGGSGSTGSASVNTTPGPSGTGTVYAASLAADSGEGTLLTGDNGASYLRLSDDGRWIVFSSSATNLVPGQHDGVRDSHLPELFLHDRVNRTSVLVTHTAGNPTQTSIGETKFMDISADGRYVAYASSSIDLVPGGASVPFPNQLFLYDREANTNTRVSHAAGGSDTPSNGASEAASISADGRWVAYQSNALNLVPGQEDRRGKDDIYLFDRDSGANILVSHGAGSDTTTGSDSSIAPVISANGRFVAYVSYGSNFVAGLNDVNGNGLDIFLFDRETGETMLVSRAGDSPATTCSDGTDTGQPAISDDGRYVVYVSHAADIVSGLRGEPGYEAMVYCFDRETGKNTLVSHVAGDPKQTPLGLAEQAVISGDGNWAAYASEGDNLVEGQQQPDVCRNIYLWERQTNTNRLVSHTAGSSVTSPSQNSYTPAISRDGRYVAFDSDAPNLIPGQQDEEMGLDLFIYDRETAAITLASHRLESDSTAANGGPTDISISADGRFAAFIDLSDEMVEGDANGQMDAFWFEMK